MSHPKVTKSFSLIKKSRSIFLKRKRAKSESLCDKDNIQFKGSVPNLWPTKDSDDDDDVFDAADPPTVAYSKASSPLDNTDNGTKSSKPKKRNDSDRTARKKSQRTVPRRRHTSTLPRRPSKLSEDEGTISDHDMEYRKRKRWYESIFYTESIPSQVESDTEVEYVSSKKTSKSQEAPRPLAADVQSSPGSLSSGKRDPESQSSNMTDPEEFVIPVEGVTNSSLMYSGLRNPGFKGQDRVEDLTQDQGHLDTDLGSLRVTRDPESLAETLDDTMPGDHSMNPWDRARGVRLIDCLNLKKYIYMIIITITPV